MCATLKPVIGPPGCREHVGQRYGFDGIKMIRMMASEHLGKIYP